MKKRAAFNFQITRKENEIYECLFINRTTRVKVIIMVVP